MEFLLTLFFSVPNGGRVPGTTYVFGVYMEPGSWLALSLVDGPFGITHATSIEFVEEVRDECTRIVKMCMSSRIVSF